MLLSIISAMNHQNIIGLDNKLPWYLPADLQRFKQITMGKPIIMGRKTFESIGKALPGRRNIVVTRQKNYSAFGCDSVASLHDALELTKENDEVFIIGGADLYLQSLPWVQKMYLTIIHHEFLGDRYFPSWDKATWNIIEQNDFKPDEKNNFSYSFLTLEKISEDQN